MKKSPFDQSKGGGDLKKMEFGGIAETRIVV